MSKKTESGWGAALVTIFVILIILAYWSSAQGQQPVPSYPLPESGVIIGPGQITTYQDHGRTYQTWGGDGPRGQMQSGNLTYRYDAGQRQRELEKSLDDLKKTMDIRD